MCDIVSGLMAASSAVSALGQMQSARAEQQAAEYQARVQAQNAEFAAERADDAMRRGEEEERRIRREGGQLEGSQRAQMAGANLDLSFGSPMDVLIDTHMGVELDAARAARNARLEAEDFDRQAYSHRAQAGMSRAEGRNARRAGTIGAIGTVLGGAGDIRRHRVNIG